MKIKIVVMSLIMMLPLISCVGGGDNSSNSEDGKLTPDALNDNLKVEITPKRVTGEKVFGYDVADLTKIGDSVDFTIKVTNTNTREIFSPVVDYVVPTNMRVPDIGPNDLAAPYFFKKTHDINDCMNISKLRAGASCTLEGSILWSAYTIEKDPLYGIAFYLTFRDPLNPNYTGHYFSSSKTCVYGAWNSSFKDCQEHSSYLFYRMNLATKIPRIVSIFNGGYPSLDGSYVYSRDHAGYEGNKYPLNVDPNTGYVSLGQSVKTFYYLTPYFPDSVKTDYYGTDQFYAFDAPAGGVTNKINTAYENTYTWNGGDWTTYASTYATPGMGGYHINPFRVGMDKTLWIGGADRNNPNYDGYAKVFKIIGPSGAQFYETNIRTKIIYGVDTTGVVVVRKGNTYKCYRQSDINNIRGFIEQPITNYTPFDGFEKYINPTIYNGVYIPMEIPNTYNGESFDGVGSAYGRSKIVAYFKIDTTNGKCDINPDNYIYFRDNQMVDPQDPDNLQINEKFWYFDQTKADYAISMPIKDFKVLP